MKLTKAKILNAIIYSIAIFFGIYAAPPLTLRAEEVVYAPPIFERLECRGNQKFGCEFIASRFYLKNGQPLDDKEIENSRLRLLASGNFEKVNFFLEKGSTKNWVVVVAQVQEASPIFAHAQTGYLFQDYNSDLRLGARLSHLNLFGAGKVLDLSASSDIPLGRHDTPRSDIRLQYIDPNLFGSRRYFAIAGISYLNDRLSFKTRDSYFAENLGFEFALGRRFAKFSRFGLGYRYSPFSEVGKDQVRNDGTFANYRESFNHALFANYGWDSEDDAYLPTEGSRFNINIPSALEDNDSEAVFPPGGSLAYRITWGGSGNAICTFQLNFDRFGFDHGGDIRRSIDGDQMISFTLANPVDLSGLFPSARNGRWYVQPGIARLGVSKFTGSYFDPALKVGTRFAVPRFGIIDLFLFGSFQTDRGEVR